MACAKQGDEAGERGIDISLFPVGQLVEAPAEFGLQEIRRVVQNAASIRRDLYTNGSAVFITARTQHEAALLQPVKKDGNSGLLQACRPGKFAGLDAFARCKFLENHDL